MTDNPIREAQLLAKQLRVDEHPDIFRQHALDLADLVERLNPGFQYDEVQFWRESEEQWVPHVHIRTWGANEDHPKRWRRRTITETKIYGEWEESETRE